MTLVCSAVIDGSPVPKGRPRVGPARGNPCPACGSTGKPNIYTPSETKRGEEVVAWKLRAAMGSKLPVEDHDIIIVIDVWPARRGLGDWDNFGKLVSDAANKVVYADDRQVVTAQVRLHYDTGEPPRTEVRFLTTGQPYPSKRPRRS